MSFQPIIPAQGYLGWSYVKRTAEMQKDLQSSSPETAREIEYFRSNIGNVRTARDLVNDRRLLSVALKAFGLEGDIDNRFFIEKILTEGTAQRTALANKLGDKRYAAIADAFGFDQSIGPNTQFNFFSEDVLGRFRDQNFQVSVGKTQPNMRIALNLEQGLNDVINEATSNSARWFRVMGTPPLRTAFEKALGLPTSIGKLDLDLQLKQFTSRAKAVFGTDDLAQIAQPEQREKLTRDFLIRAEAQEYSSRVSQLQNASLLLSQIQFPDNSLF